VLEDDVAPQVRATALVAEVRLGSRTALDKLRTRLSLDEPASEERGAATGKSDRAGKTNKGDKAGDRAGDRAERPDKPDKPDPEVHLLVEAVSRAVRDPQISDLLIDLMPRVEGVDQAKVAVALLELGHSDAHSVVRNWLRDRRPSGVLAARAIAAISQHATLEDIDVLHDLMPYEDDMEVNVELACALLRLRDPSVTPILRAALWTEPVNRSVLAGALWIDALGIDSLRLETEHPPQGAGERGQRRVGFALGEWGGIDEVERLSARRSAGDPVLEGAVLGALGARTH
jgi:NADH:ubiquinone oxidoreductase subunit C